jgi:hypothetical protein
MERTKLMVGEGVKRLREGSLSPYRPGGESRRLTDYRILWKGTALLLFAPFPTINLVLSNAAKLRLKSHHVVRVPMENRPPMTRRDGASELPNLKERCEPRLGGQRRTPQTRGPAVAEFTNRSPTEHT